MVSKLLFIGPKKLNVGVLIVKKPSITITDTANSDKLGNVNPISWFTRYAATYI